eukprot:scaffold123834_cov42-Phaeocystis_antarctica.AAC.1
MTGRERATLAMAAANTARACVRRQSTWLGLGARGRAVGLGVAMAAASTARACGRRYTSYATP